MHSSLIVLLLFPLGTFGLDLLLPNLTFLLEGIESQNCLEVNRRGSLRNNAKIDMWDCSEGFDPRLQWQFKDIKSSVEDYGEETSIISARISNIKSGKCLAVRSELVADASPIVQVECDSSNDAQLWLLKIRDPENYPESYQLISHQSGKCLDVFGGGKNDGASLIIFACGETGYENQLWNVITKIPEKAENGNRNCAANDTSFLWGIGLVSVAFSAINTIILLFLIWSGKINMTKDDGDYYQMDWDTSKDRSESERTL